LLLRRNRFSLNRFRLDSVDMITLDFETRSAVTIHGENSVGSWSYSAHPTTEPICLAWAVNDGPVKLWAPESLARKAAYDVDDINELFDAIATGHLVEAHNVAFERHIWGNVMIPRFGFPAIAFDNWRCSMAKAAFCGFPFSLEALAKALKTPIQKDKDGAAAMKRVTAPEPDGYRFKPPKYAERTKCRYVNQTAQLFDKYAGYQFAWNENADDLTKTFDYCKTDVEAERAASEKLPAWDINELAVWQLDQRINDYGLAVDRSLCFRAVDLTKRLETQACQQLTEITGGLVTTPHQGARIIEYINARFSAVRITSIDKESVTALLSRKRLPAEVRRVLEIRQNIAASSLKKYPKMLCLSDEACGVMRGALQYHGAFTGRWSGRGAQVQNFPRVTPPDIETLASVVTDGDENTIVDRLELLFGDPVQAAKQLLRGAIVARPGRKLLVWDYGQIEARVLSWVADDSVGLGIFQSGRDPYKAAAVEIFSTAYDSVDSEKRQVGKWSILGLGYGMGAKRYRAQLESLGLEYPLDFCSTIVKAYRAKFPMITRFWKRLDGAAIYSVETGKKTKAGRIQFSIDRDFLKCRLPSGRFIYYFEPRITKSKFGGPQVSYTKFENKRQYQVDTYGGKLCENICQAIARDFMADGMQRLDKDGFDIVATVHDEVLSEVDDGDEARTLSRGVELLTQVKPWGVGCPLTADGFATKRYKKG